MKSTTRCLIAFGLAVLPATSQSPLREAVLRDAAIASGVRPLNSIIVAVDPDLADVGEKLFASDLLSFNSDMSCQTCHLDRFSSADGLANAIGTGGRGEGAERAASGGDIVPRNTLALWGRGSKGFDTFFWDGKVRIEDGSVASQFGGESPDVDPLTVAVHLPFVEIREMVSRDEFVEAQVLGESVDAAERVYSELIERVRKDPELGSQLSAATGKQISDLVFRDVAVAIAAFIRQKFAVRETRFHNFVEGTGRLSESEIRGGLTFFGKGKCSSCHSGVLFSDLDFHAMPFLQSGIGKNGFGVDYGRFNVTKNPADMYAFRTPPLINVARTAPYTHSGAVPDLPSMIRLHVDPLYGYDASKRSVRQRREDLARLLEWRGGAAPPEPLSKKEIRDVSAFLSTLSTPD